MTKPMNAFISYSHKDASMLDYLHKHLIQLKRDGLISAWTDNEIPAGGRIEKAISNQLNSSEIFIALVSPDYIASGYCYNVEFESALNMEKTGKITIVPIILEPCDWLNTPFKDFKALPKDGKAISLWDNKNTAFLDVTQNIRRILQSPQGEVKQSKSASQNPALSKNYRVQKDFDSLEKLEFTEKAFTDIKSFIKRYIDEVVQLENIKARVLVENDRRFECIIVNRNKIATESQLKLSTDNEQPIYRSNDNQIQYSITNSRTPSSRIFVLGWDAYQMFWQEQNTMYPGRTSKNSLNPQEIADIIWNEWLESVGII